MIELGKYNKLKVLRKSDLGYMLSDGHDEILMHFKQAKEELKDNDEVEVFVYSDDKKRPTGTQDEVLVTVDKENFVTVKDVLPGVGVFVGINCPKDILISKDYLPYDEKTWPQKDDVLFVRLKVRKNILTAKPLNRFEINDLANTNYEEKQKVEGYICKIAEKGVGIITKDISYVYVPFHQLRGEVRLGMPVEVSISKKIENEYYGILNEQKEDLVDVDKKTIMDYLEAHNGILRLTAKSSSEEIEKVFNMSRKAFKRALGGLYKERLIDFDEEKTFKVKF